MNKKIVLGLGLCFLLTVINLHRAMNNYGITDTKFKVGVLADESSSSSSATSGAYTNDNKPCTYILTGLLPYEKIRLFNKFVETADDEGKVTIDDPSGKIVCETGGNESCFDTDCRTIQNFDVFSITQECYLIGVIQE